MSLDIDIDIPVTKDNDIATTSNKLPLVYLADNNNLDYLNIVDYVPSLCYASEE